MNLTEGKYSYLQWTSAHGGFFGLGFFSRMVLYHEEGSKNDKVELVDFRLKVNRGISIKPKFYKFEFLGELVIEPGLKLHLSGVYGFKISLCNLNI